MTKKQSSEKSIESTLAELEKIVESMERGDTDIESSLKDFERGLALAEQAKKRLQDLENKIEILARKKEK